MIIIMADIHFFQSQQSELTDDDDSLFLTPFLSLRNYNKTGEEKIFPVVAWGASLGW